MQGRLSEVVANPDPHLLSAWPILEKFHIALL
jgi:hypothetical protein